VFSPQEKFLSLRARITAGRYGIIQDTLAFSQLLAGDAAGAKN